MWIFRLLKLHWKKVCGNNVDFSTSEITSKKVRGNHVDFSTIEITSKKVRGNHVDFSTSEITSKKYVETPWISRLSKLHRKSTRKWRGNWSKFGLRRIDVIPVDSTWCARWETTGANQNFITRCRDFSCCYLCVSLWHCSHMFLPYLLSDKMV